MNYLTPSLEYYQGDRASPRDVPCALRPAGYVFTGTISLDPQIMWRAQTLSEVTADKESDITSRLDVDKLTRLLFEMNFDQENRLRTLQGLAVITRVQYRNALINTWKSL